MISFQLTNCVLCVFMTLSGAHISTVEPNLKVMTLTPSTDHVINNVTQNVSLHCAFNSRVDPWQTPMVQILRIRILRSDVRDQSKLMAEIREEDGVRLHDSVVGHGQVKDDNMQISHLNITWPIATATTFGKYQCDALGYDKNLNYVSEKSNSVILTDCQMETEKMLSGFQHDLHREIELIDEKLKLMDISILYHIQNMENKVSDLRNKLMALNESLGLQSVAVEENFNSLGKQLSTLSKSVQHLYKFHPWPEGNYSLLEPLTGCPRHTEWKKGYHKLHTESSKTHTQSQVSSPTNLPAGTLTSEGSNHFVVLNFCSKVTSTPGIPWPRGSYCINSKRNSCPPGFGSGYVGMGMEDTQPRLSSYEGYTPDNNPTTLGSRYYAYYCCRWDGPATTPIDLPTADPFYLYRFNGTCQSVTNMQVNNEYIIIDTEDKTKDRYYNEYHPDGSIDPVRLELCYYSPK